jgi:hypothetical protein
MAGRFGPLVAVLWSAVGAVGARLGAVGSSGLALSGAPLRFEHLLQPLRATIRRRRAPCRAA